MANEKATIKVVADQLREYNTLLLEHNTLLEIHKKTVDDYFKLKAKTIQYLDDNAGIEAERYRLRKEVKSLKQSLDTVQEDLEFCQRALSDAMGTVEVATPNNYDFEEDV